MNSNTNNTHPEDDRLSPTDLEAPEPMSSETDEADNVTPLQGTADNEQIATLEQELAKSKDQTLRALAELENIRKRSQKDREDTGAYAISKFARDLLSVADNLRRALDATPEDLKDVDPRIPALLTGVEATERELLKVFEQNGIKKIAPLDEKFNPNFHEVMFEAPIPDKPAGIVIQVIEAGYVLKDRLLRAAKVGISKETPQNPAAPDQRIIDEQA